MFIPNGLAGNLSTVDKMKVLARARASELAVREFTLGVLRQYGIGSHDYINEARAIGDYVKNNVVYRRDPEGVEQLLDPLLMIQDIQQNRAAGDCDDMALLIATMLLSVGCQPYFRTVRYNGTWGPYNHIYVVVYDRNSRGPSSRLAIDAIVKDRPIGYEVPHASGQEHAA